MQSRIARAIFFFAAKLGRCASCMQLSLVAALAAWGLFGAAVLLSPGGLLPIVLATVSAGTTMLWTAHVVAYAARATASAQNNEPPRAAITIDRISRRRAIGQMLRGAGVGVAASIPVLLWPSTSFAFCGQCTKDEDCGVGFVCRNTAPVNSGTVCNECVKA